MKWWLWLIIEILVVSWLFSACSSQFKEYKTVHPEFIHGSITEEGKHDFTDQNSICTKNIIKCTKFRIDKDFDSDYSLKFYFYDSSDGIVDIREMSGDHIDVGEYSMPKDAVGIRVVISRFSGFSDFDALKFRYFDLGLEVSTRNSIFYRIQNWWEDLNWLKKLSPFNPRPSINGSTANSGSVTGETWVNGYDISFRRGEIDTLGFVDANDKSAVYTQDLISCDGYRLTFYSGTNYLCCVHYYTADGRWLSVESVKPGDTYVVQDSDMPSITADDGSQLSAAGIRICLVKAKTDFTGLNPSANEISFFDVQNADKCLSLDICSLPVDPAP